MQAQALNFIARHCAVPADALRLAIRPLGGGLQSSVARATVRSTGPDAISIPRHFVIKELRGLQRRETAVYQELWHGTEDPPVARVLAVDSAGDVHHLYLEDVRPLSEWPWTDTDIAAAVCRVLARLHGAPRPSPNVLLDWNYEAELAQSARDTLALALAAVDAGGVRFWRRLGDLRRVVAALPHLRARILENETTFIHGDMHPGNVIVRFGHGTQKKIVLIDWARARLGSGLEDIASWLHSLSCWDPEAKRRHDTLLWHYLAARGGPASLKPELRIKYWFASASNGLAGAIRYHLAVLGDPASSDLARANSQRALPAWERVIRRASALLPPLAPVETEHGGG